MQNALGYPIYEGLAEKVDAFLRGLGIDPMRENGENRSEASYLLAAVAQMLPKRPGYVAVTNCYYWIAIDRKSSLLLRIAALARLLDVYWNDPVASAPAQGNEVLAGQCLEALRTATHLLSRGRSCNPLDETIEDAFASEARWSERGHRFLQQDNYVLRFERYERGPRLVLYHCGDFVEAAALSSPELAREVLLGWRKDKLLQSDPAFALFSERVDELFRKDR